MLGKLTGNRFVILSPSRASETRTFRNLQTNSKKHGTLLAAVQRFRGSIYAADGAVGANRLTADGRHRAPGDEEAWHLISLGPKGEVRACLRFLEESHALGFDNLLVRHSAALDSERGPAYRRAVEQEMSHARKQNLRFGEVGGWAVGEQLRNTTESIRILLAMYGLLELLGGCLGVATATWRHHSAGILRRIGLQTLQSDGGELPPYFEPCYDCKMELLRFDSRLPNPKYKVTVRDYASALRTAAVVREEPDAPAAALWPNFDVVASVA